MVLAFGVWITVVGLMLCFSLFIFIIVLFESENWCPTEGYMENMGFGFGQGIFS